MPSNYNNYAVSQDLADRLAAQEQNANMMGQSLFPQGVPQAGDPLGDFLSNLNFGGQSQLAQDLAVENGIPAEDWTAFMNERNAETAHSSPWITEHISRIGNYTAEHPAILLAPLAIAGAMGAFGAGAGGGGGGLSAVGGGATSGGTGVGNLLGQGWQSLGSVSGSIPAAAAAPTAAAASTPGWLSSIIGGGGGGGGSSLMNTLSLGAKGAGALSQLMPEGSDAQNVLSTASDIGGFIPGGGGGPPSGSGGGGGGGLWGGIKNIFTNPDTGAPAWGRIAGAGAGALALLGGSHGERPTQGPTALASPPLRRLPLNRTVTGLPSPEDYFTYGQNGGEHQFFSDNALPPMRRGGHYIKGIGSGRSDDIDAKLSNDEYVMDAETVALLGDGSPEEGARRLDELRSNIRKHKGQQLAKGKFSADAKRPEEYLRKAKGGKVKPPSGDLSQAYRGYLIKHAPMQGPNGQFYISKDGSHISSPRTLEEAKQQIDELVGEPIHKAKGGRIRGDWVERIVTGEGGLRSPLTDVEKRARLAAVQRFRDAMKKPDGAPKLTVVKSRGGAVESLTKFAGELETVLNSGARVTELEQQLNTTAPGSAQFLREGFAKGGKIPSLVDDFFKQRAGDPEGVRSIIEELRKLKPQSDVLRSYESAQRNKKPLLRDPEALKLLERE
jgi:hypothetical protein